MTVFDPRKPVSAIDGVETSAEIRASLKDKDVVHAHSGGKDAWATAIALRDAGARVYPYYMHLIPDPNQPYTLAAAQPAPGAHPLSHRVYGRLRGLAFVDEYLDYCEEWFQREFGTRILRLLNPSFYRWLHHYTYQPPERCAVIDAANLPVPDYHHVVQIAREHCGLPADAWVCDGVRAADSPMRRIAMASHGPRNHNHRKLHPIWDWRKYHVMTAIEQEGIHLSVDYDMFGRSFDGLDARFTRPIRDRFPDDYARIQAWFPLVDLALMDLSQP
ncbi:hypothetical protein, partial [Salinispora vitiensis]